MNKPMALLSFCNDIDFADWATYREAHHVLENEFGFQAEDSFWLFDPAGSEMALFADSLSRKGPRHDELLEDVRTGRLAILHGAGNYSRTNTSVRPCRSLVAEGLAYLREHARVPTVWTNHGDHGDVTNLGGASPVYQQGDDPGSDVYVLDLLLQSGVRFFSMDHHACNTFAFSADGLAWTPLLVREVSRTGHAISCFLRYRGALPKAPDARTLALQLSEENVDSLIRSDGVTVVYQHWCVHRDEHGGPHTAGRPVFPRESSAALARLARYREQGYLNVEPLTGLLSNCSLARQGERHAA